MLRRILWTIAVGFCFGLGAGVPPEAQAQELRGDIVGVVSDSTGGVLPGVMVTLSGPKLILPQTMTTNSKGEYRFPSLQSGIYSVTFELSGFKTTRVEGVNVTLRKVVKADARLGEAAFTEEVEVVAQGAAVDVQTTAVGTSFDEDVLATIPTARDIWSTIALAPGFQMAGVDVGGSHLGSQTNFAAYGNAATSRTLVEGVITGDGRNDNSGYFDYGSFAEFEMGASGNMGEVAGPGAIMNFSVKSGGDSFRGSGLLTFQNDALRSDNVPDVLRTGGAVDENGFKAPPGGMRVGNNISKAYDVNFDLGGPLKRQKAWFYVSGREQNVYRTPPGVPDFEAQTRLRNVSGKLNYAINAKNTLIGYYNWREKFDPDRDVSTLVPALSSRRQTGTAHTAKLEWTSVISERLFLDLLGAWYYSVNDYVNNYTESASLEGVPPGRQEITTGAITGANPSSSGRLIATRGRPQASGSLSYSPSNHTIKAGFQVSTIFDREERWSPTDTYYYDERGIPVEVDILNTPIFREDLNRAIGVYLQDSWKLGPRLTVNGGLRYDNYKLGWPDQEYTPNQGTFFPPVSAAARTAVTWNKVAPRLGFAWDIGGNGKTVLKAYGGRGYIDVVASLTGNSNPVGFATRRYEFRDANGNRLLDPGELGRLISTAGGAGALRFDPNVQTPYGDELSAHLERELFKGSALRLSYVYKTLRDHDAEVDLARVGAYTVPFAFRDVGPDNVSGTADDQVVNLFDRPAGVPSDRVTTTPGEEVGTPGYDSDFHTLEFGFNRRMQNHWMLSVSGSHLWSKKFQAVSTGTNIDDFVRHAPAFVWFPNSRRFGRETETTWSGKVIGRYEAPWGISASTTLRVNSGYNWARRITPNLPVAGRENMPAEPITSNRGQTTKLWDIRLEKALDVGNTKVTAIADIFNVLNSSTVTNFTTVTGPQFMQILALLPPRAVRFGVNFRF
jgi:hypothetical protein